MYANGPDAARRGPDGRPLPLPPPPPPSNAHVPHHIGVDMPGVPAGLAAGHGHGDAGTGGAAYPQFSTRAAVVSAGDMRAAMPPAMMVPAPLPPARPEAVPRAAAAAGPAPAVPRHAARPASAASAGSSGAGVGGDVDAVLAAACAQVEAGVLPYEGAAVTQALVERFSVVVDDALPQPSAAAGKRRRDQRKPNPSEQMRRYRMVVLFGIIQRQTGMTGVDRRSTLVAVVLLLTRYKRLVKSLARLVAAAAPRAAPLDERQLQLTMAGAFVEQVPSAPLDHMLGHGWQRHHAPEPAPVLARTAGLGPGRAAPSPAAAAAAAAPAAVDALVPGASLTPLLLSPAATTAALVSMFDNSRAAIFTLDTSLRIFSCNAYAPLMLGETVRALHRQPVSRYVKSTCVREVTMVLRRISNADIDSAYVDGLLLRVKGPRGEVAYVASDGFAVASAPPGAASNTSRNVLLIAVLQ